MNALACDFMGPLPGGMLPAFLSPTCRCCSQCIPHSDFQQLREAFASKSCMQGRASLLTQKFVLQGGEQQAARPVPPLGSMTSDFRSVAEHLGRQRTERLRWVQQAPADGASVQTFWPGTSCWPAFAPDRAWQMAALAAWQ